MSLVHAICLFLLCNYGGYGKRVKLLYGTNLGCLFKNLIGVVLIGLSLMKLPVKEQVGGKLFLPFFRGFMGFLALVAFFYNIAHISLADAMTFSRTSPIFTAIFAFLFLK